MRLGEILLGAELVTPYQLAQGLDYAKFKVMPIGRVLVLLRYLEEEGLKQALQAQQLIRGGMPGEQALDLLRQAINNGESLAAVSPVQSKQSLPQSGAPLSNFAFSPRSFSPPSQLASSFVLAPEAGLPEIVPLAGGDSILAGDSILTVEQLMQQAETCLQMDECAEALKQYQNIRVRLENDSSHVSPVYLNVLRKIGNIHLMMEDYTVAQKLFEEGMAICADQEGELRFYLLQFRCDFADLLAATGQSEAALAILGGVLVEGLPYLQERQPDYVAWLRRLINCEAQIVPAVRKKLGEILLAADLLAPEQLRQALSSSRSTGIPIGRTLKDLNLLSERDLQSVLKAQTLLKEGIIGERTAEIGLKAAHILNQNLEVFFAQNQILIEDLANADPNYVQLILMQDQILVLEVSHGPEHLEVGKALLVLSELHEQRGHICDAEVALKRAEKIIQRQTAGPDPSLAIKLYRGLARVTLKTGQMIFAQEYLLVLLDLLQRTGREWSEDAAECLLNLALIEQRQGNLSGYVQYMSMYVSLLQQIDYAEPMSLESLQEAAKHFQDAGMYTQLEELLNWQLHLVQRKFGKFEPEAAEIMLLLGDVCAASGERDKAQMHYHLSSQIYEHSLGKEDKAEIARTKLYNSMS